MDVWLGSILWLLVGCISLLILRLYRGVILKDLPSDDPETPHIIYRVVQGLIVCISLTSATNASNFETDAWYQTPVISSIVVLLWCLFTIRKIRQSSDLKKSVVSVGMGLLIGTYLVCVSWNFLPAPLKFLGWFRDLPTELQSLTAIVSGLLLALLSHKVIFPITARLTQQTESDLDDSILESVRLPVSASIALIGFGNGVANSLLSDFWIFALHGISLSLLIWLWTQGALKVLALVLAELLKKEDTWHFINERTLPIFQLLFRIAIITMSVYLFLLSWNINIMLWITSAGVLGIAAAYASQDTLSSLFSGVAILSDAPYKLHDYLILDNETRGRVTNIGFRSTRLLTTENVEIIIPNSIMANVQIINMSGGETSQARIEIIAGVAYGSDIELVRQLLLNIAKSLDHVILDRPNLTPVVHFTNMGASSLDFTVRLWISNPENIIRIQDQANTLIYNTFNEHNIEIPYTKQDVYLYSMDKTNA